jgi:glycosyltransferase involved in cell wall biosynthesis
VLTRVVYPGLPTPRFIASCIRETLRSDVVYAFFASEHALVPAIVARALRRRFVLVPAGYDYANIPERKYGLAARGRGWMPRLIGRLASVALPISRQTMWEFLALVPSAAPRTQLAYLAVDPTRFEDPVVPREADLVVTVAHVDDESWSRKGIDRFVEAARRDPGHRYLLVGKVSDSIRSTLLSDVPSNLSIAGRLSDDELRETLWRASAYVQLSWHETFGVAMAEAMLCGCVPVITDCPALREVAGRWAVLAEDGDSDVAAITRGLKVAESLDTAAMRRDVAERFSVEARTATLAAALGIDAELEATR